MNFRRRKTACECLEMLQGDSSLKSYPFLTLFVMYTTKWLFANFQTIFFFISRGDNFRIFGTMSYVLVFMNLFIMGNLFVIGNLNINSTFICGQPISKFSTVHKDSDGATHNPILLQFQDFVKFKF